ncbi:hypothetical protein M0R45_023528 [Rubus argutus]|uniref:NAC domain-containing protein n=1 Tax=Rubus argutus TaxID=59490 RepID=A0AAW1WQD7_RUBAR
MPENLPPGFRFHPTDEELITYYLGRKVSDVSFTSQAVAVVDLNKCEPWDLPGKASMGEKEWYFFNLRDRKYPTGLRTNRATEAGLENKRHPFKSSTSKEEWVVCRVFQKSIALKKPQQITSSSPQSVDSPCDTNSIANEFGDVELPNFMNNIGNSSSGFISNNMSIPQNNNCNIIDNNINNDVNMISTTLNMNNWLGAREAAASGAILPAAGLASWPSSLLSPLNLSSVNSFLLRALQLRSSGASTNSTIYQQRLEMQRGSRRSLLIFYCDATATTTDQIMDSEPQSQQHPEQPFNLDSIW